MINLYEMNVRRLYYTVKHLKRKQVLYRIIYWVRNKTRSYKPRHLPENTDILNWPNLLHNARSYRKNDTFEFLNLTKTFDEDIDWDFSAFGKLWTYNLNYFDFLLQESLDPQDGLALINDFINKDGLTRTSKEPYPISLRGINWIKFLSMNSISEPKINQILFSHYHHLFKNIEYHLMGNHLLENGFSLIFGAYHFKNEGFHRKGFEIVRNELTEQLLEDGGHFERSTMYHQILLFRLMDTINLIQNNSWKASLGVKFLKNKASAMLSWLETMSFRDGSIPMVNDSTYGIAPSTSELRKYANLLGIEKKTIKLSESGYRKAIGKNYEMFMDVGNIGPDYQPGHAHADTLSFVLHVRNLPLLVDCGVSTYEVNARRQIERSTFSHNTVTINRMNQSEVWAAFRVARRAYAKVVHEKPELLMAMHDGYKRIGASHSRTFRCEKDQIEIIDEVEANPQDQVEAHFHFHPETQLELKENVVLVRVAGIAISFEGNKNIFCEDYYYASGYNKLEKAQKVIVRFSNKLTTRISL